MKNINVPKYFIVITFVFLTIPISYCNVVFSIKSISFNELQKTNLPRSVHCTDRSHTGNSRNGIKQQTLCAKHRTSGNDNVTGYLRADANVHWAVGCVAATLY